MTIPAILKRLVPIALVCAVSASADYPSETLVARLRTGTTFRAAAEALVRDYPRFVDDIVRITEVPAPPFAEEARGTLLMEMLREAGLDAVERDDEGNVMGVRRGTGGGPLVAISAHLDTVFPAGTDVRVRRTGTRLSAPGVGDDSQALALLLAVIRAMDDAAVETTNDLLFVGTVGEEGAGSLRGVRHLFLNGRYRNRISAFVSIDGVGPGSVIVTGAVGSERHRITFTGPGGHSYASSGIVNPAYALAGAMQRLGDLRLSSSPRTTLNIGRMGGGTSVNAIPSEAWMEVDLRSESPEALATLAGDVLHAVNAAAAAENDARSTAQGRIVASTERLDTRPAGHVPRSSSLVKTAEAATRAVGLVPQLASGSTDANLPISLGIPAITIDSGLVGGRAHAPDEWIDVEPSRATAGIERVLLLVLSLAGAA